MCFRMCDVLFPCVSVRAQLWVEERMPLAASTDHGHNLQTVQLLIKKNQVQKYTFTINVNDYNLLKLWIILS